MTGNGNGYVGSFDSSVHMIVTLVEYEDGRGLVATGSSFLDLRITDSVKDPKPGMHLMMGMNKRTGAPEIVGFCSDFPSIGMCGVVNGVYGHTCEVEVSGMKLSVAFGSCSAEEGDRVVIDNTRSVLIGNLGRDESRFRVGEDVSVTWDQIGGLAEAKEEMIDAIEGPIRNANMFKHYKRRGTKGVLLFGPPGCGKTLVGKATATSLAAMHGKGSSSGFMYVKGPEILNKWVGSSEQTIRELFSRARKHKEKHGYPAVIFIDEAEAVLSKRGTGRSSDMEKTIVPMFLSEMDGMEASSAIVLLATNRSDQLDPAVVRDGRIDRRVRVGRPDERSSEEIMRIHLAGKPFADGFNEGLFISNANEMFHSENSVVFDGRFDSNNADIPLKLFISGAMIEGLVERTTACSIKRDVETGTMTGIAKDDLAAAFSRMVKDLQGTDHLSSLNDELEHISGSGRKCTKLVPVEWTGGGNGKVKRTSDWQQVASAAG